MTLRGVRGLGPHGRSTDRTRNPKEAWKRRKKQNKEAGGESGGQISLFFEHTEYRAEGESLRVRTKAGWRVCAPGNDLGRES